MTDRPRSCTPLAVPPSNGPLAPFDNEVAVVFRGPLTLRSMSVYNPDSRGLDDAFSLVALYDANTTNNMVFANFKSNVTTCGTALAPPWPPGRSRAPPRQQGS